MIKIYNMSTETYVGDNVYNISRDGIFGNPFTHIKNGKTKADVVVGSRDEAIDLYSKYFDRMYDGDEAFRKAFDEMFERYERGEDIYLGCYCAPLRCHGEIIEQKLVQFSMRKKLKVIKFNRNRNG